MNDIYRLSTRLLILLAAAVPLFAAAGEAPTDLSEILSIRAATNDAIARHDVAGLVASFDMEYQVTTGKGDFYRESPEELRTTWTGIVDAYDDVIYVRSPVTVEVSSYLALAAETGTWTGSWTTPEGPKRLAGRYAASWRKVEGNWCIHAELFVTLSCDGTGC